MLLKKVKIKTVFKGPKFFFILLTFLGAICHLSQRYYYIFEISINFHFFIPNMTNFQGKKCNFFEGPLFRVFETKPQIRKETAQNKYKKLFLKYS
jgi:hypothetical protein